MNFRGRVAGASLVYLCLLAGGAQAQGIVRTAEVERARESPVAPPVQAPLTTSESFRGLEYSEVQLLAQSPQSAQSSQNPPSPSNTNPEKSPEKPAAGTDSPGADSPKIDKASDKEQTAADEAPPKRMFGMIPDFENTNNTPVNQKPLSVREKFVLAWHQSTDFSAHVGAAFAAGLQQWGNGQPRYGEGWGPYGQRFLAAEGDQMTSSWLIYGVFPSLLHDDPRYFRRGTGSPPIRVWYALTRTFVTRRDNGKHRFNYSTVSGQLVSCAISTSYYPEIDRAASRVFTNWGLDLVGFSAYNVLSEYYPDLVKALFHRGKNNGTGSGS